MKVDELLTKAAILSSDAITAKEYGNIKSDLRKKGKPIPENDIWIAAIAIQYGLKLITKDFHFKYIDNPDIELFINTHNLYREHIAFFYQTIHNQKDLNSRSSNPFVFLQFLIY